MLTASQVRAAARMLALICLAGLCGGGAVAQSMPPLQLAALTPAEEALLFVPSPIESLPWGKEPVDQGSLGQRSFGKEPFNMPATHSGAMPTRWRGLQPALRMEARILDLCRANPDLCTAAATSFLGIVEAARGREGRARIGEINRAINLAIRPESDLVRFHVPDVWATPLTTFASGVGDCEDYAIAKYVALRQSGVAPEDLRIVIVHNPALNQDHAVAAARVDGEWLILDNRTMLLLTDDQTTSLTPLVTLDDDNGEPRRTVTVAQAG